MWKKRKHTMSAEGGEHARFQQNIHGVAGTIKIVKARDSAPAKNRGSLDLGKQRLDFDLRSSDLIQDCSDLIGRTGAETSQVPRCDLRRNRPKTLHEGLHGAFHQFRSPPTDNPLLRSRLGQLFHGQLALVQV